MQATWFPAWEEVHIYWPDAPADGGSAITHYEVQIDDGDWMSTSGPDWEGCTLYSDFGLLPGRTYQVRVRAVNAIGAGDAGQASVTLTVPPSAPEPDADPSDNSVTLSWEEPADGGSPITHYGATHFKYQDGAPPEFVQTSQFAAPSSDGEISHAIDELDGSTKYLFQVWAITEFGWGPVGSISAVTGPVAAPQAPTIARIYPGDGSLAVTWAEPATPGAEISSYDLRYIDSAEDDSVDGNWTEITGAWSETSGDLLGHTLTQLANADSYGVQVRAINSEGTSAWSANVSATPQSDAAGSPDWGSPSISGSTAVGQKLAIDVTGVKNPDHELHHFGFRYRWLRSGDPIDGATGASYILAEADEGEAIAVRVTFQTKSGHRLSLTSEATAAVSGPRSAEMSCAVGEPPAIQVETDEKGAQQSGAINTRSDVGEPESSDVTTKGEDSTSSITVKSDEPSATRSIDENPPPFTPIGAAVTPSDSGTQRYSYSLKGAGTSFFGINSKTGQLLTGHPLDYETRSSYMVEVVAERSGRTARIPVEITVNNIDEPGSVTLTWNIPQVEVDVVASLTDPDGGVTGTTWQWLRADRSNGTYNPISGANSATYQPTSSDSGKYLRAKASYSDAQGSSKEAFKQTRRDVRAASEDTSDPDFYIPDQYAGYRCTPHVVDTYCLSTIRPTTPGRSFYYPTYATDEDGDEVAYSLSGSSDFTDHFEVDRFSGQLRAKKRLDQFAIGDSPEFTGTITATDPSGGSDSITVNINLTGGQGRPVVVGPKTIEYPENGTWRVATYHATVTKNAGDTSALSTDGWIISVQPGGGDGDYFDIDDEGILRFMSPPDFENPKGSDYDKNTYDFSLHVYDSNPPHRDGNRVTYYPVTVIVTNSDEEFQIVGRSNVTFAENGTGPVASYTAPGGSGTLAWSLGGDDDGKFSIDGNGVLRFRSPPDFEAEASAAGDNEYLVDVTVRDQVETLTRDGVRITVTDVNEPPTFDEGASASRTVDEDSGDGEDIGDPVKATDPEGAGLAYTLGGTDAASFDVDSSNGQLRTATDWNSANKASFEVTVSVTDNYPNSNVDDSITVTISVGEVNGWPEFASGANLSPSIAENSPSGTVIETYSASDPENDRLTYSLGGDDKDSFDINSNGQLLTDAPLDFEDESGYQVEISVTDGLNREGNTDTSADQTITVDITVTDVNEPPQLPAGAINLVVQENTPTGRDIGNPISADDPEDDQLTYTLGGTDAGAFDIVSGTGQLLTKVALDHESKANYSIEVSVSDGLAEDGITTDNAVDDTITVTVTVTDMNEPPLPPIAVPREVAENTPAGRSIGLPVSFTDPDRDRLTYSLSGADAASFDINTSTGQLLTSAPLNFETNNSYSVTVQALDGKDEYGNPDPTTIDAQVSVNIDVTDVYEPPQFEDASTTRSVVETDIAGTDIGAPVDAVYEEDHTLVYDLGGTHASKFAIDPLTGQLRTDAALDFSTPPNSYSVTVSVHDGVDKDGSPDEAVDDTIGVTINVIDTNRVPGFGGETATRSVLENTPGGQPIGDPITAEDLDGDELTYILGGTDSTSFAIDTKTGQLLTDDPLDFESQSSYSVTVSVGDDKAADGTPDSQIDDTVTVTISIVDMLVPETPPIPTVAPEDGVLSVTWPAAVETTERPIDGYRVRYREDTSPPAAWIENSPNVTFDADGATIANLEYVTDYEVGLQAYNAEGDSPWSESGDATTNQLQISLNFGQASYSVNEGDEFTVLVTASPATNRDLEIPISVTPGSAEDGDYQISGLTANNAIEFQDGGSEAEFTFTAVDDTDRSSESLTLGFGQLPGAVGPGATGTARVTIIDDERSSGGGGGGGSRNRRATGLPVISGFPEVGRDLDVSTDSIADADGLSDASFTYGWIRELEGRITVIPGQSGDSYTMIEADIDHTMRVRVSFRDDRGNSESLTSDAVGPVLSPFGRRPSEETPSRADPDAFSTDRAPVLRVLANRYVEGPGNDNLKHNIPNLEIRWGSVVRTADFLTHYDITGGLERWGYPVSEVMVLEPGALTQFYQRGAVDFHNVGLGWVIERRLTWEYVGGIHSPEGDQGTEPFLTNPYVGELVGPWGHKVSNYSVDGVQTHFADVHNRLGGTLAFGFPLTDGRINFLVPGLLHAPGTTPGFVRQFYQAAIFELHPYPNNPVMLTLLGDILRDILVPEHARHAPFNAVPELVIGQIYPLYYVNDAVG